MSTSSTPHAPGGDATRCDVVVVGAGPAGSTAAAYLADLGLDVALLEKSAFPREKVCGDGLTPRAVRELVELGVPTPATEGWMPNRGLRLIGGGHRLEVDWPDVAGYPRYGLVRTRADFDAILARHAVARGATLVERANVTEPIRDDAAGRVVGVRAKVAGEGGERRAASVREFRAPLVVAADGNSSRLSLSAGRPIRDDRPMGVAVRTYYTSPRTHDDYLESWMELWSTDPHGRRVLLPGYGWIFGVGDGTSNVGLGILNTSEAFGKVDYRDVMRRWVATLPPEWTFTPDTMTAPIRGAALPMGLNRAPLYGDGLLLLGDAGGMVNPFNGEGIAYAMQSARIAAQVVADAWPGADDAARERGLSRYPDALRAELGGYFTLGRQFARLIGHPEIMRMAVAYGLPRRTLMRFVVKVMAGLYDPHGGRLDDRVISTLHRLTPSA